MTPQQASDVKDLATRLLQLEAPWIVRQFVIDDDAMTMTVHVEHQYAVAMACPECGRTIATRHDSREVSWRDADWAEVKATLTARMPRVRCPEHGVKMLPAPWATRPRVGTTRRFERLAIAWLKVCSMRETAVRMGVSDKQIARIQHDAVTRGKARLKLQPPTVVHVDETSYQKSHKYVTVINDADRRVRWVVPGRDSKTLGTYYKSLGQHGLQHLRHAVMDMSKAYIKATLEHTSAAIVIDNDHVAARLVKAVDQVRRAEHRARDAVGDDRLKGTQHLFRCSATTMQTDQREQLGYFKRLSFKVARAWQRCEMARQLWSLTDRETAMVGWRKWLKSARLSRLMP